MGVPLNVTITSQRGGLFSLLVTDLSREDLEAIADGLKGYDNEVSRDLMNEIIADLEDLES